MTTASENRNILQLENLETPYESGQLYVVHDGRDYRISIESLFSALSKGRVGLDRVDNTSDEEKPVSTATELAISEAIAGVIGREEFDQFVSSIQDNITTDVLDQVIAQITIALDSKLNQQQVVEIVTSALQPIQQQITILSQQMDQALQRIAALEAANYVTQQQLGASVAAVTTATDQKLSAQRGELVNMIRLLSDSVDARFLSVTTSLNAINASLANKSDRNHQHIASSITDFDPAVTSIVNREKLNLDFKLGVLDW